MTEHVVAGSSMAALVAADRLAADGHKVRLLLSPGPVGGGFGSLEKDGRVFELGVRFLELSYEGGQAMPPPLSSYRPGVTGHRPFAALIRDYIAELAGDRLEQVERPRMLVDGRLSDDLYFTTDPTVIRQVLGEPERELIAEQAHACEQRTGDAAGVLADTYSETLRTMTLTEASLANHGTAFHELFMVAVAEKFVPGGCDQVMAEFRRKVWLPLFWPRTLAESAGRSAVSFSPDRPLHTVRDGGAGQVVASLQARLADGVARGSVEIAHLGGLKEVAPAAGGRTMLRMGDGTEIEAIRPVLGVSPAELYAAAGIDYRPAKARTVICWIEVADSDISERPSLINVVDAEIPATRISTGGRGAPGHQLFTVELRHDTPNGEIAESAKLALKQTGVLRAGAPMHDIKSAAVPSFPLPTFANAQHFASASAQFAERRINAAIVGGATVFGSDALGEQIVQGHYAAAELAN